MEILSPPSTTQDLVGKRTVSLQSLPLEIQLRTLTLCLTTNNPIIDYLPGSSYETPIHSTVKGEQNGQHDISLAVLSTCHTYRAEGLKIFTRANQFVFTQYSDHPSLLHSSRLFDYPIISNIKNLTFRHIITTFYLHSEQLHTTAYVLKTAMRHLPMLQNLEMDFVPKLFSRAGGPLDEGVLKWVQAIQEAQALHLEHTSTTAPRQLQNITMTGLLHGILGHLAIKLASNFLRPDGTIGLGHGRFSWLERPTSKHTDGKSELEPVEDLAIEWMEVDEVDAWIREQRKVRGGPYSIPEEFKGLLPE